MLSRGDRAGLAQLSRNWPWLLCVGLAAALPVLPWSAPRLDPAASVSFLDRASYSVPYALAASLMACGSIGAFLTFFPGESAVGRYLADASYWPYLMHFPVVLALEDVVARWPLHWAFKFPLILTVALVLLLVSYDLVVRDGPIGALLNGRRLPRAWRPKPVA
jgi:peptidoglycan/LPS O-acetylase OafA/YrhL